MSIQLRDIPYLTDAELNRAISDAEAHRRNADTDSSWNSWDARLDSLYHELEQRELTRMGG